MRRVLRGAAAALLLGLATWAAYAVKVCMEADQRWFAASYGAVGSFCLAMAAATLWPERRGQAPEQGKAK